MKRVVVLKGGPSSEREVSLRSGAAVAKGLREAGYDVTEVDIRDARLDLPAGTEGVFIALHGEFGEDGQVQELLRRKGVPYTGSDPAASARAFDKVASKQVFTDAGIPTAAYAVVRAAVAESPLPLPVVVKPAREGSSIGLHKVTRAGEWAAALGDALDKDDAVIVEAYIPGRELTVGVVGDQALPVIEIVAPNGWYDYGSKYTAGACRYLVPAPIEPAVADRCRELGLKVFAALGCRGMGRVDFRLAPDNSLYVLELNSIPGFTETSLLPKAAAAAGITFPLLCDRIMGMAAV